MSRRTPGQARIPGANVPAAKGRVRWAVAREVHAARARGVEVSPASVTVIYVLADQLDRIERDLEDRYLLPQLVARLLDERRAANTLPTPTVNDDDVFAALTRELTGAMGDPPPT